MRNVKVFSIVMFILYATLTPNARAAVSVPNYSDSYTITNIGNYEMDYRTLKLKIFFKKYNSPLTPYAKYFVYWADVYNIDWRLIPAISGVESTFGKRIPKNSFNAYGWANGEYRFSSWEDSIEHVTKTLRLKYKDKGAVTIKSIARRYAPPSSTWGGKVEFFMSKIDSTPLEFDL